MYFENQQLACKDKKKNKKKFVINLNNLWNRFRKFKIKILILNIRPSKTWHVIRLEIVKILFTKKNKKKKKQKQLHLTLNNLILNK